MITATQREAPVVEIGRMRPDEISAVAQMHFEFFGGKGHGYSLARLGPRFLADVFYRPNVGNPCFFVDVARVDGCLAAFGVYASDLHLAIRGGLRRHPMAVLGGILRHLLRSPLRTVRHLLGNLGYARGDVPRALQGIPATIMLIGTRAEYRSREFRERTGTWITGRLWEGMEETLRRSGCSAVWTAPAVHNAASIRLFERLGFIEVARGEVQGEQCIYHRKNLQPAGAPASSTLSPATPEL